MILTVAKLEKEIYNSSFRTLFPELEANFSKFMRNPGCSCRFSLFSSLAKGADRMHSYFGEGVELSPELEAMRSAKREWTVVNCGVDELEDLLNGLKPGSGKEFAVARHMNNVTVVIRESEPAQ